MPDANDPSGDISSLIAAQVEVDRTGMVGIKVGRRRRLRRAALLSFTLACLAFVYYHAFCNWPLHGEAWTRERIGPAIERGFDYLYKTGTFGRSVDEGGESPPHHLFLELVLARHDHPGLREQMARGRAINDANWEWRTFFGMPGWPRDRLTALDRSRIEYAVNHSEDNVYAEWLLYGLYPSWTKLRPGEEDRLFVDTSQLGHSYQLTHALLMYVWMSRVDPAAAEARHVDRLIRETADRLYMRQSWDPCTSDIYNERVAFFLYMDDPPPIKRRWIERILLSQNIDGGWSFDKSAVRTLGQFVGYEYETEPSYPHGTFLALYALSEYQARLDEGKE